MPNSLVSLTIYTGIMVSERTIETWLSYLIGKADFKVFKIVITEEISEILALKNPDFTMRIVNNTLIFRKKSRN
jgi:hypothetical protein